MEQINFRVSDEMAERIDAWLASLQARMPGIQMTRSDAIRDLLERGLKDVESQKAA